MALQRPSNGRLIPGAPEAIVVSAHHIAAEGWSVKISIRRQFELWGEAATATYERLSTEELVDVCEVSLALELLG